MTAPRTPHQNGVAEGMNMTLLKIVRVIMNYVILPTSFLGYALNTVIVTPQN